MNTLINLLFTEIHKITLDIDHIRRPEINYLFDKIAPYCYYVASFLSRNWTDLKKPSYIEKIVSSLEEEINEYSLTDKSKDEIKKSIDELKKIIKSANDILDNIQKTAIQMKNVINYIKHEVSLVKQDYVKILCHERDKKTISIPSKEELLEQLKTLIKDLYPITQDLCIDLNNDAYKLQSITLLEKAKYLYTLVNEHMEKNSCNTLYVFGYVDFKNLPRKTKDYNKIHVINYDIFLHNFISNSNMNAYIPNSSNTAEVVLKEWDYPDSFITKYLTPLLELHDTPNNNMDKNNPEFKVPQELKDYLTIEDKSPKNTDNTKSSETLQNTEATSSILPNINTDIFESPNIN